MQAANKVAFNTLILYTKMLITMGISLYSTRLVLNALGASDYGIFNLIAGVIAMLSFLNAAMTISTQRYLSFYQGTNDFEMQKKVFTNSWALHIIIGLLVVLSLEIACPFLFDNFLNIPQERIGVAKTIYHFMSIAVFFTIVAVPFTASLNAHENMLWIAVVNIIESVIKLGIALSLLWFIQSERLVVYGVLMVTLSLITFSLYAVYCLKKYSECNIKNYQVNKPLMKELGGFAGWNLFGALCGVSRAQGLAVILNIFFGTVVNAAYGIANQVSAQLSFFSQTMLRAINPQIMKSEGMNDRQRMLRLSMMASKFGFFLMALVSIPCIFEMPAILTLWLKNAPENSVVFSILILIDMLVNQLTVGLQSAIQAVGKVKIYQIFVGGIQLFTLPVAYLLLLIGFAPYSVLVCATTTQIIGIFIRFYLLKKIVGLSIIEFCNKVFFKEITPIIVIISTCWIITAFLNINCRFFFTAIISAITFVSAIYLTGLCKDEKIIINEVINKRLNFHRAL